MRAGVVTVFNTICAGIVTFACAVAAINSVIASTTAISLVEFSTVAAAQAAPGQHIVAGATHQVVNIDQGVGTAQSILGQAGAQIGTHRLAGRVVGIVRSGKEVCPGPAGDGVIAAIAAQPLLNPVAHGVRCISRVSAGEHIGSAGTCDLFNTSDGDAAQCARGCMVCKVDRDGGRQIRK